MRNLAAVLLLLSAALPLFAQTTDSKTVPKPAMILFFFNKPAFEQCLRAMSSHPGEKFTIPAPDAMAKVREKCHVMQN